MKAELKEIEVEEFDRPDFWPNEKDFFSVSLVLSIGPEDEPGADYYRLKVRSHSFLEKFYSIPSMLTHVMIAEHYDFDEVKEEIISLISKCEGENYAECAIKLSKIFAWEFEDYHPCEE